MLWVKALHLIFMVTWFAGLFYLPRLFVYHAMTDRDDLRSQARFVVMERKLFYGITTPGGILTIVFGTWLLTFNPHYYFATGWVWTKLILIGILVIYHIYCGILVTAFKEQRNPHGHVWYRWFNEFPVLILIAVVILAVVRPF